MNHYDVIVIGAGAAGLMCAATAGQRGRKVWLIDHAKKTAEKIRISGGGRANFTNLHCSPSHYLSKNPHFCKSALKQYTQHDFIDLVKKHDIAFHEKKFGQLFCDKSAQDIIDMLLSECADGHVQYDMEVQVENVKKLDTAQSSYSISTSQGRATCDSLVIATGGLSIPKIGATKFGYDLAKQFNLPLVPHRAGLVPLTFQANLLEKCKNLSGLSLDATIRFDEKSFREGMLFTHRGLSGPSILQISSFWREGEPLNINLLPSADIRSVLKERRDKTPKQQAKTVLADYLPNKLAESICTELKLERKLAELGNKDFDAIENKVNSWTVKPSGTEGYRTAEVTLGGVDTDCLSSKTMECKDHKGLFFIGEVVDVTGHLGGFNFQWAWSSGVVAGRNA